MKKIILFGLVAIMFQQMTVAQGIIDTTYYDKDWKGAPHHLFSDYYRIAFYPADSNYKKLFRDYYVTGELRATGSFVSIDKLDDTKSIFDGKCVVYFKNGKINEEKSYQTGILNGEFCEYFENGLIKRKGNFINGHIFGLYTEFLEDGCFIQEWYSTDGKSIYNYYIFGNSNGQFIKISYSDNKPIWESPDRSEIKTEYKEGTTWGYYVKNGLTIAQASYDVYDSYWGRAHRVDIIISNNSGDS